jgi:hypothetical protein
VQENGLHNHFAGAAQTFVPVAWSRYAKLIVRLMITRDNNDAAQNYFFYAASPNRHYLSHDLHE